MNPFSFVLDLTRDKRLETCEINTQHTTHNTQNNGDEGCDSMIR